MDPATLGIGLMTNFIQQDMAARKARREQFLAQQEANRMHDASKFQADSVFLQSYPTSGVAQTSFAKYGGWVKRLKGLKKKSEGGPVTGDPVAPKNTLKNQNDKEWEASLKSYKQGFEKAYGRPVKPKVTRVDDMGVFTTADNVGGTMVRTGEFTTPQNWIYLPDPNDPRIQSYRDSVELYQKNDTYYPIEDNVDVPILKKHAKQFTKYGISPVAMRTMPLLLTSKGTYTGGKPVYKKPVQPYIYWADAPPEGTTNPFKKTAPGLTKRTAFKVTESPKVEAVEPSKAATLPADITPDPVSKLQIKSESGSWFDVDSYSPDYGHVRYGNTTVVKPDMGRLRSVPGRSFGMGGAIVPDYIAEDQEVVDFGPGETPQAGKFGKLNRLSSTSVKIEGDSHDDPSGGVEMTGGERVFSDRLYASNSFSSKLRKL